MHKNVESDSALGDNIKRLQLQLVKRWFGYLSSSTSAGAAEKLPKWMYVVLLILSACFNTSIELSWL